MIRRTKIEVLAADTARLQGQQSYNSKTRVKEYDFGYPADLICRQKSFVS